MSHAQRAGTGKATRPAHGKRRLAAFVCVLALVLATTVSLPSRAWADADDDAWAGTAADAAEPEATDASEDEGDEPANTQDAVQSPLKTVRPSSSHQLYVEGTQLVDNEGNPAVLRGVSTHGLAWFPQYVNDKLFAQLSTEWDCNLVRLALYSEDYCKGGKEAEDALATLRRGIDACINNDMYVLVDWHILKDGNPNSNIEQAKVFFETIAKEYASSPNVLYEICNEPNGETSWSDVYAYAEQVIPIIRANSPHAVIIVGTPNYDREVASVSRKPLPFENVMYTLHFYATTHKEDLRGELEAALDTGVPVFVTECGLCEATGDGPVNFDSAVAWFELLDEDRKSVV